ncbi:hypothetical protein [Coleofasciculus chthonoplastes]|uniref:hypothetical protein n=1 Tax=Coleofasciculus TaxID=669368 RepID=UPI0032F21F67
MSREFQLGWIEECDRVLIHGRLFIVEKCASKIDSIHKVADGDTKRAIARPGWASLIGYL